MTTTEETAEPRIVPVNQMIAKTTIQLDYSMLKKLKHYAIDNDMRFNEVVTNACYEYLDKRMDR